LGLDPCLLDKIEAAFCSATEYSHFPSHLLQLDVPDFNFPTMFQGNMFGRGKRPAGDIVKHSSKFNNLTDQEPIVSRAHATKHKTKSHLHTRSTTLRTTKPDGGQQQNESRCKRSETPADNNAGGSTDATQQQQKE
jgi:hypothetical protein